MLLIQIVAPGVCLQLPHCLVFALQPLHYMIIWYISDILTFPVCNIQCFIWSSTNDISFCNNIVKSPLLSVRIGSNYRFCIIVKMLWTWMFQCPCFVTLLRYLHFYYQYQFLQPNCVHLFLRLINYRCVI